MNNAVSPWRWSAGCAGPASRPIGPAAVSAINSSAARPRTTTWPATPRRDQVRELFGRRRTLAIGAAFGVAAVIGHRGSGNVEVTTFRRDAAYSDGRHPDSVTFSSAAEDAARRDFTINGLFYDPIERRVIDFVGGQDDLAARLIRAIGSARDRFAEDKLRMLRAVRFTAAFGFALDPEAQAAIAEMAPEIHLVSPERIAMEMRRMLSDASRAAGVRLLWETGLAAEVLPEIVPRDDSQWQRFDDTLSLLARLGRECGFPLALGAVLSPWVDAAGAAAVCQRWRLSNKEADRTCWLVENRNALADVRAMRWSALQPLLLAEGARRSVGPGQGRLARRRRRGRLLSAVVDRTPRGTRSPAAGDRRRPPGPGDSSRPGVWNVVAADSRGPVGWRNP